MSTRSDPWKKISQDFSKRTEETERTKQRDNTYVVLSARRLDAKRKDSWLSDNSKLGSWRQITILDADHIAQWMGEAPAVARWFSGELDRPSTDIRDVETFLRDWSTRTEHTLPPSLVLLGQDRQDLTATVSQWLERPAPSELQLAGEDRIEALLFVAAVIDSLPEVARERFLARTMVVDTLATYRWLAEIRSPKEAEPPIFLIGFAEPLSRPASPAHVFVPLDPEFPDFNNARLPEIPWGQFGFALEKAGFDRATAERLARESRGSLRALQRLLGDPLRPAWAQAASQNLLVVLLLVGGYQADNAADRQIIQRLGADPDELDRLCARLGIAPEMPILQDQRHWHRPAWKWRSIRDAWRELGRLVTSRELVRYAEVMSTVLSRADRRFESNVPATTTAHRTGHPSESMVDGLFETLLRLSVETTAYPNTQNIVDGLVREALTPSWKRWASLGDRLPLLAESSPSQFLSALDRSLAIDEEGASRLLAEQPEWRAHPHTGLLWALETLAWHPKFCSFAARALATLTERDQRYAGTPGRYANRALASLELILAPEVYRSETNSEDRLSILREVFERHPVIGRIVAVSMLPSRVGKSFSGTHRPESATWVATLPAQTRRRKQDVLDEQSRVLRMLIEQVGDNREGWIALVRDVRLLPHSLAAELLEALENIRTRIDDQDQEMFDACRDAYSFSVYSGTEDKDFPYASQLKRIYEYFEPGELVASVAWLFRPRVSIPEPGIEFDWHAKERWLSERRRTALESLWKLPERRSSLQRLLSHRGVEAQLVGLSLADLDVSQVENELLYPSAQTFINVIPFFVAKSFASRGLDRTETLLHALMSAQQTDAAVAAASFLPPSTDVWAMVTRLGEPFVTLYWKQYRGWALPDNDSIDYAVRMLLSVHRFDAALRTASYSEANLSTESLLHLLESICIAPQEAVERLFADDMSGFNLEKILRRLDQDSTVDRRKIVSFEVTFFPLFAHSNRALQLHKILGENAEEFADLLARAFLPESAAPRPEVDEKTRNLGAFAYRLINSWSGYPGSNAPPHEREQLLYEWSKEVVRLSALHDRRKVSEIHVAEVLARAPASAEDSEWPCVAARRLLAEASDDNLMQALAMAEYNRRGVTSRSMGDGGQLERNEAAKYRSVADTLRVRWPDTSRLLDRLASDMSHEAEQWDADALHVRREYGIDKPPRVSPSEQQTMEQMDAPLMQRSDLVSNIVCSGVGPSKRLEVKIAPRLTLMIGENGAGKTFVLDMLFWVMTGKWWRDLVAWPRDDSPDPSIAVSYGADLKAHSRFDPKKKTWGRDDIPLTNGLVFYVCNDGTYAIWDSSAAAADSKHAFRPVKAAELWEKPSEDSSTPTFLISVWNECKANRPVVLDTCQRLLDVLSPEHERIKILSRTVRPWKDPPIDCPLIEMPYGPVPIVHAPAGVRRILGIAFLLAWSWHTHRESKQDDAQPRLTLLFDEIEAHLHPRWERRVLPALIKAIESLEANIDYQIIGTTHGIFVPASMEKDEASDLDALMKFDLSREGAIAVSEISWLKRGDANNWASSVFGFDRPYGSSEAEEAVQAALAYDKEKLSSAATREEITARLVKFLPNQDPFLIHWMRIEDLRREK